MAEILLCNTDGAHLLDLHVGIELLVGQDGQTRVLALDETAIAFARPVLLAMAANAVAGDLHQEAGDLARVLQVELGPLAGVRTRVSF